MTGYTIHVSRIRYHTIVPSILGRFCTQYCMHFSSCPLDCTIPLLHQRYFFTLILKYLLPDPWIDYLEHFETFYPIGFFFIKSKSLTNLTSKISSYTSINRDVKSFIISIALIAHLVENQVLTLKIRGSILAGDKILFLIINPGGLQKVFQYKGKNVSLMWIEVNKLYFQILTYNLIQPEYSNH